MAVAIVIDDEWEVTRCLPWALHFARAANESLSIVLLQDGKQPQTRELSYTSPEENRSPLATTVFSFLEQSRSLQMDGQGEVESSASPADATQRESATAADDSPSGSTIDETSASSSDDDSQAEANSPPPEEILAESNADEETAEVSLVVQVFEIGGADKARVLLDFVDSHDASLLVLPRHVTQRGMDPELPWEHMAFRRASCATMQLRPAEEEDQTNGKVLSGGVLAPVNDTYPSLISLRWAQRLRRQLSTGLTAMYVEPDVGELAQEVGGRILSQIVRRALPDEREIATDVVVGATVRETIRDYAAQGGHRLVVLGANRMGVGKRWLKSSVTEWLMGQRFGAAVAVVRPPIPFAHRFSAQCADWLMQRVPQLDRESRISLYERIQNSSRWDFDFVALICLSTIIASLGLLQNSAAVVIGAMLVAPLMTPIVGAGLALVQGNRVLIKSAWATVLRGFLLAFFLAMAIGFILPGMSESQQMLARGSPNILDLVIALISGIAASYALGRPNLYSALPGVAIAAALVPPVATAGLAVAFGNFSLAGGALLLFATNIVAIVLGTGVALFAVGIRATHEHGVVEGWVYRIAAILIVAASIIAAYEFVPHHALPVEAEAKIKAILASQGSAHLSDARQPSQSLVQLTIQSPQPLDDNTRSQLAETLRRHLNPQITVQIETRLVTTESPP